MNFTQAPLPFQGQKRKFLRSFKEALKTIQAQLLMWIYLEEVVF